MAIEMTSVMASEMASEILDVHHSHCSIRVQYILVLAKRKGPVNSNL